ncbi:MAG: hypothetical protein WD749_00245 [Phycisphaerales bacterium]
MRTPRNVGLLALPSLAGLAAAQTLVIPPANESVQGTSSVVTMFNSAARSAQWVIPGSDLALAAGFNRIEGFTTRTRAGGTVPATTQVYANYDVYVGELAVPLGASLNPNFADNVLPGTEVQVRAGSLAIPAGSFPTGSAPNAFGTVVVDFNVAPFTFDTSKNYAITVRHTGNGASSPGMDANSNAGNYRGMFVASYTGTTSTSNANYTITRLHLGSGGCYANCDGSTTAPVLNVQDFGCFLTRYAAGEAYANCDGSTTPPVLNVQDFGCFLTKYAAGCP